ncbi:hypothetical protein HBH56_068340 [Parastagonospora nodorum]|uniref:Uncharacterized protein n=1 Tax=Phaeosphaeria nodorum (strain SN15 / ATCC MYA-4574 / FGSC 10173) TaxID=321614 RepID=A0A7U2EYX2_PHANO|nr:hypothetical protein HBH56_068340 [Parastagonospora nodorum]QRC93499.1 hypothetical protein JI435_037150 [Parastagonospora nodorum SN15]KAH4165688.1 hypothetical protein HBH44_068570 [Parastagonospora nodorum]KAH5331731.1 hypothetical protein HBI50_058850 [Parastagonospora nodorum]KAH5511354.1 hypothetical protein HBI31_027510 [Parastagonospora nodorum]
MLRNSQGLAPNFQNIGQPITGPLPGVQPPVQAYAKKRHVYVWRCCRCGQGSIPITSGGCTNCGCGRCAYCTTTKVQVRTAASKKFHLKRSKHAPIPNPGPRISRAPPHTSRAVNSKRSFVEISTMKTYERERTARSVR